MSGRTTRGIAGLLVLLVVVSAGNLLATYRIVQDSKHHRSAQVCTTLGALAARGGNAADVVRLLNAFGSIYGCDWSRS
jgi:hypothetical protein